MKKRIILAFLLLLFFSPGSYPDESSDFYIAKKAIGDGLYKIAESQLIQFIKENPESASLPEAYFYLGESFFNLGNYSAALPAYAQSLKSSKLKEASLYRTASCYYLQGEANKCVEFFRSYLSSYPAGRFADAAAFRLGECFMQGGEFQEAAGHFLKTALNLESKYYAPALLRAALASLKDGGAGRAGEILSALIETHPDSKTRPEVIYWLAHAHLETGSKEEAGNLFKTIVEEFPDSGFAHSALYACGYIKMKDGGYERAAAVFRTLLEKYPLSPYAPRAGFRLGMCLEELGSYQEAAAFYSKIVDSPAGDDIRMRALYRKASAILSSGEDERAMELFNRIITVFPESREAELAKLEKCIFYYRSQNYAAVIQTTPQENFNANKHGPGPAVNFLRAGAHSALGEHGKASEIYRAVLAGKPGSKLEGKSMFYLGRTLREKGECKAAADNLSGFLSRFPESDLAHEAYFELAEALFELGEFGSSVEYYLKSSEAPGLKNISYLRIGDSLRLAGEQEKALDAYAKAGGGFEPEAAIKTAEIFYLSENFPAAAEAAALVRGPEAGLAKYITASACMHNREIDKAAMHFAELIEQFPNSRYIPAALFNLGAVNYSLGNREKACNYFRQLDRLFPEEPETLESKFLWGICLMESGSHDPAAEKLEEYVSFPGVGRTEQANLALGELYHGKGLLEKAREKLSPVTGSDDEEIRVNAAFRLGRVFEDEKNYARSFEMFSLVLETERDPEKILEAMMRSASVLSAQDEHEKALSIYTGIIEKYPGHELAGRALYNQSRTLQSLGRYRRAVETLRKIEQPLSEQMEAEINLLEADCLFQLGDYEEALLGYLKTAYLYPLHEAIVLISLESAAKILRVLERDDEATKIYKKIIKLDPEGIKGEMASQKLKEVGK